MQTKLTVLPKKLTGIKEGPAVFRVSARDRSLWGFFKGNETVIPILGSRLALGFCF
jgi:hypothetical protein